jgi:hypothetical protein
MQFLYSAVTGNFFSALNIDPALGRFFRPGEGESSGGEIAIVLGHSFWQKKFGGDPAVVGKPVRFDGRPATVIGVAPKEFHGLYAGADMDGYVTLRSQVVDDSTRSHAFFTDRTFRGLTVYGRLKPGVTLEQAQASMSAAARRMEEQYPDTDRGSESGNGKGLMSTPLTTLNIAVLGPIPKPSVRAAITLNSGLRRSPGTA